MRVTVDKETLPVQARGGLGAPGRRLSDDADLRHPHLTR